MKQRAIELIIGFFTVMGVIFTLGIIERIADFL